MTTPLTNKVLLIGWDAADWKVITPLIDEGKMPNLKQFLSEGVMGLTVRSFKKETRK
jgi:predicted AlkP superfamily phosphohydrolase/phosphomutase